VHNHVLDPASLLVNRRAKSAKTDGIDVERMQRALGRHLRGEPDACSVVRVPSVEEEDAKRLHPATKVASRYHTRQPSAGGHHSRTWLILSPGAQLPVLAAIRGAGRVFFGRLTPEL